MALIHIENAAHQFYIDLRASFFLCNFLKIQGNFDKLLKVLENHAFYYEQLNE